MKRVTVKGIKAIETQKILESNGYKVLSFRVTKGRQVVIEYK